MGKQANNTELCVVFVCFELSVKSKNAQSFVWGESLR